MTVKVKNNKLSPLTTNELKEINGGSTDSNSSITMSSSTNSLLSIDFEWQQGSNSKSYKIEAGKDIDLSLNIFGTGANLNK